MADIVAANESLARAASSSRAAAAAAVQSTSTPARGGGAAAALISTSMQVSVSTRSQAPTYSVGAPQSVAQSSSAVSSSRSSSASSSSVSSSASRSSSVVSSTSSASSSSASPTVTTITRSAISSSASQISVPSTSADAAKDGSSTTGLGTGAVVGIVLAVLVGVVILGSALGWLYRKFASRGYKDNSRWRKLDEDITPFTNQGEKYHDRDDIYGGSAGPIIGSGRALNDSMSRDGYGSGRPMTEYDMFERGNRAGVGSGMEHEAYNGRGMGQAGYGRQIPASPYGYPDEKQDYPHSPNGYAPYEDRNQRQLVGNHSPPSPYGQPMMNAHTYPTELAPHALGRPAAPQTYDDIAHHEDFAEEPLAGGYPNTHAHAFSTQNPIGVQVYDRPAGATPTAPVPPPAPLPAVRPVSSFASAFDFGHGRDSLSPAGANAANLTKSPAPQYNDDEQYRQKQLYGEVARAAGFPEPKTPHSASSFNGHGDQSIMSNAATANLTVDTSMADQSMASTTSSFSVPERLPVTAPAISRSPAGGMEPLAMPSPYQHGRPLSPLVEVSTPSTTMTVPVASSSLGHAREVNPFDHHSGRMLVAPHSAASSIGATMSGAYPSARYPPPSPGMSIPGSVGNSPLPGPGRRVHSIYDEEDAYGGI